MHIEEKRTTSYFEELPKDYPNTSWGNICDAGRPNGAHRDQFPRTDWTLLQAGADGALHALDTLARAYWSPLYGYARRRLRSEHDAEDVVQSFMVRLTDPQWLAKADSSKGKFRAFMLSAFKNQIIDFLRRLKPEQVTSFDEIPGCDVTAPDVVSPDMALDDKFRRDWQTTLTDLALQRLSEEQQARGKGDLFGELRPHLGEPQDLAGLAMRLGMPTGTVKVTLARLRNRLEVLIREEVARTLDQPTEEEIEAELLELRAG